MTKKFLIILAMLSFTAMATSSQQSLSKKLGKEPPEGFLQFREP